MARRFQRRDPHAGNGAEPALAPCPCCGRDVPFLWRCRRCDFAICQRCMDDNLKMFTCNNVTWWCADCGESNGY